MNNENGFLGTGWAFPPSFDSESRTTAMCSNEQDIKQSLQILLSTTPGERIMHPEYGCGIHRFVFAELTRTALTELESEIKRSILLFESRIDLHSVVLTPEALEGKVLVQLDYEIVTTNTRDNMVYPFYLQEGTLISTDFLSNEGSRNKI